MEIKSFSISRLPQMVFGEGGVFKLPELMAPYGKRILLMTGGSSFTATAHWEELQRGLAAWNITWELLSVGAEPSPQLVDDAVQRYHGKGIEAVVAIGGGSVLDAAKAVAGLLPSGNSVLDYLEGVGRGLSYEGPALPFIAVPTTAGTGSEATKNAVLSELGEKGYKKSFRHDSLMAQVALIDPLLLESCPSDLIAAQGMDAFTQLLESYVSSNANPFCDALAFSGLEAFHRGFFAAWQGGSDDSARQGRAEMAYAALLSGITLAQCGLGSVHGLASPVGAFFPIPHGVVCGTLVAVATEVNIRALRQREPQNPALEKYAKVGELLSGQRHASVEAGCDALVSLLQEWTERLKLPHLAQYGVTEQDMEKIVANSRGNSMRTNPVVLSDEEIAEVVRRRL